VGASVTSIRRQESFGELPLIPRDATFFQPNEIERHTTTRRQANRIAVTEDSRVLDVGCGIGGPARYLAHTYGCRVDGIDLTPELIETGQVLTERCKLADRVVLQVGNALDLPYPDQTFDVVWCQNVTMNIADKS